jgi:WD40 repeat protein
MHRENFGIHIRRGRGPGPSGAPSRPGPVLTGHAGPVMAVQFSPDGQWLASGSYDATARVWDAASGTLLSTLAGHQAQVFGVAFHPREALLATGSIDQTVRLWSG